MQFAITLGLGWAAAAAQVFFSDVTDRQHRLAGGFYLTPVVYPMSMVPVAMQRWILLNPLATVVAAFRAALVGGPAPTRTAWLATVVFAGVFAGSGWWLFVGCGRRSPMSFDRSGIG
ncbi:MAG: hypothetical protein R2862_13465 [Thermoanaerobaculia bacterium]